MNTSFKNHEETPLEVIKAERRSYYYCTRCTALFAALIMVNLTDVIKKAAEDHQQDVRVLSKAVVNEDETSKDLIPLRNAQEDPQKAVKGNEITEGYKVLGKENQEGLQLKAKAPVALIFGAIERTQMIMSIFAVVRRTENYEAADENGAVMEDVDRRLAG